MAEIVDSTSPFSMGADVYPGVGKLVEEIGELLQQLGRLIQLGGNRTDVDPVTHWKGQDVREEIRTESADVLAALSWFSGQNGIFQDWDRVQTKLNKYDQWRVTAREKT